VYRKNRKGETSGVPPTRVERPGGTCLGGNVLHPLFCTYAVCWISQSQRISGITIREATVSGRQVSGSASIQGSITETIS